MSTTSQGPILPNGQNLNLGNLYINGAKLTWLSTTTMSVAAGLVRDSTDSIDIIVGGNLYQNPLSVPANASPPINNFAGESGTTNPLTVGLAVTINTALQGAGGVDVNPGTALTASSMYAVYALGDSRGFNAGSAMISLQFPYSAIPYPSMPLGYDTYRYIGAVGLDSSKHIRAFMQTGAQAYRTMWYDPGVAPGATANPTTTGLVIPDSPTTGSGTYINVGILTSLVPQKLLECLFDVSIIGSDAGDALYMAPATIDNGTTASVGSFTNVSVAATTYAQLAQLRCPVSLPNAAQIAALTITNVVTALVATTTTDAIIIKFSGYIDQL